MFKIKKKGYKVIYKSIKKGLVYMKKFLQKVKKGLNFLLKTNIIIILIALSIILGIFAITSTDDLNLADDLLDDVRYVLDKATTYFISSIIILLFSLSTSLLGVISIVKGIKLDKNKDVDGNIMTKRIISILIGLALISLGVYSLFKVIFLFIIFLVIAIIVLLVYILIYKVHSEGFEEDLSIESEESADKKTEEIIKENKPEKNINRKVPKKQDTNRKRR